MSGNNSDFHSTDSEEYKTAYVPVTKQPSVISKDGSLVISQGNKKSLLSLNEGSKKNITQTLAGNQSKSSYVKDSLLINSIVNNMINESN